MYEPQVFQNIKIMKEKLSGEIEEYASKVIEIKDDIYTVENPTYRSELVLFLNGSRVRVMYMVEKDGMRYFDAEVVEKIRDRVALLVLKRVSDIQKNQRRNFYRIDACLDVELRKIDDILIENTISLDMSAGGMKVSTSQKFKVGDIAEISFYLNDSRVEIESKVVKITDVNDGIMDISLEFLNISENEQDAIVKFIFEKQRENLKKRDV